MHERVAHRWVRPVHALRDLEVKWSCSSIKGMDPRLRGDDGRKPGLRGALGHEFPVFAGMTVTQKLGERRASRIPRLRGDDGVLTGMLFTNTDVGKKIS